VEDGRVELGSGPGGENAVTGVAGRLSVARGVATVKELRGDFRGVAVTASGSYGPAGLAASGEAASAPLGLLADFDYSLAGGEHGLRAGGRLKNARFTLNGKLDAGSRWSFALASSGLPLSLARADLPDLEGDIAADGAGRYFTFGRAEGAARLRAALPRGAALDGSLKFSAGAAALKAALRSPEISGSADAAYSGGAYSGAWSLKSKKALSFPLAQPLYLGALEAKGTLGGRGASPAFTWDVAAASAAYGAARADLLTSSGRLTAGGRPRFKAGAGAINLFYGRRALGSADLAAEGTPEANDLRAAFSSPYLEAELEGTSRFRAGAWTARWTSLRLRDAPEWRLCGPFTTEVSAGRYGAAGFCATDGRASAALTFRAAGGESRELDLAVDGLALESFAALRSLPLPPAGLVSARARYAGAGRRGTLEFSGSGLKLKGLDFGTLRVDGTFTPKRLEISRAEWKAYDGVLSAAGSAALGAREPDLRFVVTASTLNVAPLLVFLPEVRADKVLVNGAAEIGLKGKVLTNRGSLSVEAPQAEILPLGLKLRQVSASVRGEESAAASFTASARSGKGGTLEARGRLDAEGPQVSAKARRLTFDAPQGLSGVADAELELGGAWKEPSLGGTVDFAECLFDMPRWRKTPPARARSPYYESLTLDLTVRSARNAWYRDPPSSIEAKGELLIKKAPYGRPAVIGSVDALKGYYTYLGNTFTLESGSLVFGGEIPANPRIDVSAANAPKDSPIKVYLHATGTMLSPVLEFTSDPAMEQRDIMSYLITGKPLYAYSGQTNGQAGQAGQSDPGSRAAAANLLAGFVSRQAAGPLVRKLDIDVLNVRMTGERAADITVGRYITPDLFVSYGQVLSPGGEKRVDAEYAITPWWSLEGKNSSQGKYVVELLFKFGIRTVHGPGPPE
jgi:translocation and assembly module TamB